MAGNEDEHDVFDFNSRGFVPTEEAESSGTGESDGAGDRTLIWLVRVVAVLATIVAIVLIILCCVKVKEGGRAGGGGGQVAPTTGGQVALASRGLAQEVDAPLPVASASVEGKAGEVDELQAEVMKKLQADLEKAQADLKKAEEEKVGAVWDPFGSVENINPLCL